jgi:flavocytochrome c
MRDVDVIVIGSGAAGLSAALTAAELGASVLIAEAEDMVGGSSRLSSGMMMAAGTAQQRAVGIADSPENLFREYMQLNQWQVDAGLARRLAFESAPAVEWLAELGVHFHDTLSFGGEESQPRNHLPIGMGAEIVENLHRAADRAGVEIALRRRVDRLLVEDGSVTGVAVGADELRAGAVIVASGGFGANIEKLREYYPAPTEAGDWMWYMGAGGSQGDALDLAAQVGAQIAGMGRGLSFLTPNFVREYEATLPGWILMVNAHGRRFCDETVGYGVLDQLARAQGGRAYVIFDEASRQAAGRKSPNWNDERVAQMAEKGAIARSDSVAELAGLLQLPVENVVGSVERYNQLVADGEDGDYLKAAEFLRPIATPPFFGAELRWATIALTSVGLRIDAEARVLTDTSAVIPGLFAAGECTGGVLGDVYVGSGNSYSNCVVFGRIAGRAAALASREEEG